MAKGLRQSEVTRLRGLVQDPPRGLSIVSVSGPGGVGKSHFLREALEGIDLACGAVVLSVDASAPRSREDLFVLLERLFRRSLPPPADPRKDYFPRLREVASYHRELTRAVVDELRRADEKRSEEALLGVLRAGRVLNAQLPLPVKVALKGIDDADLRALVQRARAMKEQTVLPGPIRDLLGISWKNRIKTDLFRLIAEELRTDLSAMMGGYEARDRGKLTQGKLPGARRLVLIFDDYEALADLLGDFLIGALVPELASAPFDTVLIVAGRDDIEATHPGWAQHAAQYLRESLLITPFDQPAAFALLREAGLPEERWQPLFEATQGYPFLLTLAIEEATREESESALFLRKFFDRTTRWMTPEQQEWFSKICYLDAVNEDTLGRLFDRSQVPAIQDWFESEASVRDPAAPVFRVRPLIRDKVLRYLERRAPSRHAELRASAAGSGDLTAFCSPR